MSYKIYPVVSVGFIIDEETAAYIKLAAAKRDGSIEPEVAQLLKNGLFYRAITEGTLPEEFLDILDAVYTMDKLNENCITCCHGDFDGEAVTTFPELAGEYTTQSFEMDQIAFLVPARSGLLSKDCYKDEQELLAEFQGIFKDAGVTVPDTYNWWAHIVNITGTYGC